MPFLNKVVIVTGSGSGIGEATAARFAKGSARLALVDFRAETLKISAENCEKISRTKVLSIVADVSNDEDVKRIVEVTLKEYGRIDVLVNCAGIAGLGTIFDKNILERYDRVIGVNLRGMIALTHAASSALVESKGNIVNVSSVQSKAVVTHLLPYCVSKAGVSHFTRAAALDLSEHGVRVNAIMPGPVETNIARNSGLGTVVKSMLAEEADNVPLKRKIRTEDVAELIAFLASDAASSMTGSNYVVDGGHLLQH